MDAVCPNVVKPFLPKDGLALLRSPDDGHIDGLGGIGKRRKPLQQPQFRALSRRDQRRLGGQVQAERQKTVGGLNWWARNAPAARSGPTHLEPKGKGGATEATVKVEGGLCQQTRLRPQQMRKQAAGRLL